MPKQPALSINSNPPPRRGIRSVAKDVSVGPGISDEQLKTFGINAGLLALTFSFPALGLGALVGKLGQVFKNLPNLSTLKAIINKGVAGLSKSDKVAHGSKLTKLKKEGLLTSGRKLARDPKGQVTKSLEVIPSRISKVATDLKNKAKFEFTRPRKGKDGRLTPSIKTIINKKIIPRAKQVIPPIATAGALAVVLGKSANTFKDKPKIRIKGKQVDFSMEKDTTVKKSLPKIPTSIPKKETLNVIPSSDQPSKKAPVSSNPVFRGGTRDSRGRLVIAQTSKQFGRPDLNNPKDARKSNLLLQVLSKKGLQSGEQLSLASGNERVQEILRLRRIRRKKEAI